MFRHISIFLLLGLIVSGSARAEDEGPLRSDLSAFSIGVAADGTESRTPARRISPGNTIEYVVALRNTSSEAVDGLLVMGPVPPGAVFWPQDWQIDLPSRFEVQTDALGWSTYPPVVEITNADGEPGLVTLPDSEITAVRWKLETPLVAGTEIRARYRVAIPR